MIVITGAAGFIGSYLAEFLNSKGIDKLLLSDDLKKKENQNLAHVRYSEFIDKGDLINYLEKNKIHPDIIFHLGARTDTTEKDKDYLDKWNTDYSKAVWNFCTANQIPMIYASSAATYGKGSEGYDDSPEKITSLKPLNLYGWSKQYFDAWVIKQEKCPPQWYGFKFFNVFGPHENLKARMASVVYHGYNQIKKEGKIKLFQSNDPSIEDGNQKRDFIYVDDVCQIMYLFFQKKVENGIYNLGTGRANTFNDLAKFTFEALGLSTNIQYIPFPEDLQHVYQNFTQANMERALSKIGDFSFTPFYKAIKLYVDYLGKLNK